MQAKDVKENELLPWQGLTLTCVRILQLYCRVFEQDYHNYHRIKEYVIYLYFKLVDTTVPEYCKKVVI